MSSDVELSDAEGADAVVPRPSGDLRFAAWFERDYPRVVGVARRVLDPEQRSDASLPLAEELTIEAFSRLRWSRRGGPGATTSVLRRTLDGCMDALVGHPGTVDVHPELLGPDMEMDTTLSVAELHDALATMRAADRHVGLLTLAAGYPPSGAALLLHRPLDDVLVRLARVGTRISDARRLGMAGPAAVEHR
jgi:DNA-directed RNA polymerase specialized sigma24 family protein